MDRSPARDAIPPAECSLATDYAGASRPIGPGCDIGAVEFPNSPPPVIDDAIALARGGTTTELVGGATSVLDNDGPDPEGDAFTAVLETDVVNGTLVLNPDGTFSYRPSSSKNVSTASDATFPSRRSAKISAAVSLGPGSWRIVCSAA